MPSPRPSTPGTDAAPPGFAMARRSRVRGRAACVALWAAVVAVPAGAQSAGSGQFGATVALTSQLVDRGIPVSRSTPILQGALLWNSPSGWSAGVSASSEARSPGRLLETLAQVAHAWSLSNDWQMQADVLYYRYDQDSSWRRYDRTELGASFIYRDVLTVGLSAADMSHYRGHGPRLAADLDLRWPVAPHLSVTAGLGAAQYLIPASYPYNDASHYEYGHLGAVWENGPWRIELKRIGTRHAPHPPGASDLSAWNATLARSF
ncbi:MAG: TorF family putative porin [Luteibacter sp.]